jgi:hypothetical protein
MLNLLLVALVVLVLSRPAIAYELPGFNWDPFFYGDHPDHGVALDLLFFSQWDNGGNPLVDEGFRYEGLSVELKLKASDQFYFRGGAVVAYLQNNPLMTLPPSVANPDVTSASTDFVTLDSFIASDITLRGNCLTLSPGLFYHHQWAYMAFGVDLEARCLLAGGDAVLRVAYSGRFARLSQVHWDGSPVEDDTRITNNFIVGFTQFLSPQVITYVGLQYTRQSGLLNSTLNFVGLYNSAGEPVLLVDEVLPRLRNRGQLSLRGRYTPSVGTGIGIDTSLYYDDWGLFNVAAEANFETPFASGNRFRAYVLVADQKQARYFTPTPQVSAPYMTQNSNLGSFVLVSPGMLMLFPLNKGPGPQWMLRGLLLGFYRTDRIYGLGASLGVRVDW